MAGVLQQGNMLSVATTTQIGDLNQHTTEQMLDSQTAIATQNGTSNIGFIFQ
ncbi:hypothetical protein [Microbulbifer sp. VAAF005]|uniref:hypothetical protein n=1 Tax=Microbulbifer sp. VAAF005 TaxID=3034230 RepID=UPI0024AD021B|nr:hypothetical protein [Microbulbifer sp. VAAF005]WHI48657.1 hypothetical protein P0078_09905 [Microbulbifer sp. VAAF005]